ncbi:dTMP kinase [Burkholderia multivorans]|uniref:dTMP kinase n=1 Tax=Burkholderia multivorans TaxID=87883 RepID=UPI0005B93DB3|nr:AAA family ATPase [Burkholderia multivorans]MBU9474623.1 AAA family ATPase [Burkholderia multivorans]
MQSNTAKFLVAIEGSDGSGKSTLIQALEARSMQRNVSFLKRSFHDQPMVKAIIRNFEAHHCITNEMLSACLWASAAYTMEQVAGSPAQLVVCDRYDLTGRLYDRFCGIPSALTSTNAALLPRPDLYVYLDLPPHLALDRVLSRSGKVSFFETMDQYEVGHRNAELRKAYQIGLIDPTEANNSFLEKKKNERAFAHELFPAIPNLRILDASRPAHTLAEDCWEQITTGLAARTLRC